MAAYDAARQIKERLVAFAVEKWKVTEADVEFLPNRVRVGTDIIPFPDFINQAYFARIQLSPPASTRRRKSTGTARPARAVPSIIFSYGASVSEVSVSTR